MIEKIFEKVDYWIELYGLDELEISVEHSKILQGFTFRARKGDYAVRFIIPKEDFSRYAVDSEVIIEEAVNHYFKELKDK
jgi:3-methyladenine DNA glycosylase AlkC